MSTEFLTEATKLAGRIDGNILRGVRIVGQVSKNGREYPLATLRAAKGLYEGVKVNLDHATATGPRSVKDFLGQLTGIKERADGLYGDLQINPEHPNAKQILWAAEHSPKSLGMSHVVSAETNRRNGTTIIERIKRVVSVDVVGDPATTGGLFENNTKENQSMPEELISEYVGAETEATEATTEVERIKAIRAICGEHPDIMVEALTQGWGVDTTAEKVTEAQTAKKEEFHLPTLHLKHREEGRGAKSGDVLEAAWLCHLGHGDVAEAEFGEATVAGARAAKPRHAMDLVEWGFRLSGRQAPHDRDDLLHEAMSLRESSTYSLPTILGATANRLAMHFYRESPATWPALCAVKNAKDFKSNTAVRLNLTGELEEVGSDGEVKHSGLGEDTLSFSVAQFAKQISVDRKHLIDDDLSLFADVPAALARLASRKASDLVFETLLGAGSHFASGNGNLLEAGSALTVASLGNAIKAMRLQQDTEGHDLDIQPATLLVGPSLELTARTILASVEMYAGEGQPTGNPVHGAAKLLVESRLENSNFTGYSAAQWFLFSSPANAPLIAAYLQGVHAPRVKSFDPGPDRLGMTWRVTFDFGSALGDPKAAVRATGAA